MQPHEYAIIGLSRTKIGRILGTAAGLLTSTVGLAASAAIDLAHHMKIAQSVPRVISFPLIATFCFPIGHLVFNKWIWRWGIFSKVLNIPDLSGEWNCTGQTDGGATEGAESKWVGVLRITQTWEQIRVYLETAGSISKSRSASILHEPGRGYVLMYSYHNEPKISHRDMASHTGYCEIVFAEDLSSAQGEYFNNKGRVTCGHMAFTRIRE